MQTPRARFRAFLDSGGKRWILPALAGAGLAHMASQIVVAFTDEEAKARTASVTVSTWYALLALAPPMSVFGAALNALLLRWTGRWLGGQATVRQLLAAIAWSFMPLALTAPLVTAEALALLRGAASPEAAGGVAAVAEHVVGALFAVTTVMSIFRMVVSVSEAQRFSKLRAAGNFALSSLPLFAALLALALAANR